MVERVQRLEAAYAELVQLAVERRLRLEESRKLWQFYWDMAEEESWMKEKEQILSTSEIGHDLMTVNLLLIKQKALEDELQVHEPILQNALQSGIDLVAQGHFGSESIRQRVEEIEYLWQHLKELAAYRRKRLLEAVNYHQVHFPIYL